MQKGQKSLADVNIPVPVPSLIPSLGYPFSILVTVAILGFMAASLFVALVVVLLAIGVPGPVPGLPVSVLPAPVALISVAVVAVRGIVVCVLVGVLLPWLHIRRVSALLRFRVQRLLPGEASAGAAAVVVVLCRGGGAVLWFLDWFQAGLFFSLGSRTGGSQAISPLITLRTL